MKAYTYMKQYYVFFKLIGSPNEKSETSPKPFVNYLRETIHFTFLFLIIPIDNYRVISVEELRHLL